MERVNISIQNQIKQGAKIIKDAGGLEEYDRKIRRKNGPISPKLDMEDRKEIIFNE
jgi:hypothetical protein